MLWWPLCSYILDIYTMLPVHLYRCYLYIYTGVLYNMCSEVVCVSISDYLCTSILYKFVAGWCFCFVYQKYYSIAIKFPVAQWPSWGIIFTGVNVIVCDLELYIFNTIVHTHTHFMQIFNLLQSKYVYYIHVKVHGFLYKNFK